MWRLDDETLKRLRLATPECYDMRNEEEATRQVVQKTAEVIPFQRKEDDVEKCYFCPLPLGAVIVAVGWGKHVHPECYEPYKVYLEQIKEVYAKSDRPSRDHPEAS